MALKFLYITSDPFVNNSEEFVRILAISNYPGTPSGGGYSQTGVLNDQNGQGVASFFSVNGEVYTQANAYPYSFSNDAGSLQIIIVPPGWKFSNFVRAIAVQGSLEEVLRVH
jgi:chitinase